MGEPAVSYGASAPRPPELKLCARPARTLLQNVTTLAGIAPAPEPPGENILASALLSCSLAAPCGNPSVASTKAFTEEFDRADASPENHPDYLCRKRHPERIFLILDG